jgi:hypothetical protein
VDESGESLAPLMENSALNTDGASGYAPALYPVRRCTYREAVTAFGATPTADDWVTCWEGVIDEPDFSGRGPITLRIRDLGGLLEDTNIEEEGIYAATPTALATVLQQKLDDWPADDVLPAPTLRVIGDPDWMVNEHRQQQTRLFAALQEDVDQIGWDLRYEWTEDWGFTLRLIEPRRGITVPDMVWGPGHYAEVQLAKINAANVRNRLTVLRRDSAGVLRRKDYANTVSSGLFKRRWSQIGGDVIAAINTEAESDRLAEAYLSSPGRIRT